MKIITDIEAPEIAPYRSLRGTPAGHTQHGIFVAEGDTAVRALLGSDLGIISMFATPDYYTALPYTKYAERLAPAQCLCADKELMNAIVGFRLHQGIMALGRQPAHTPLEHLEGTIIVLAGIVNAENVGAIIRNARAFGVRSAIVGAQGSSPFLRRAVRVSMGAVCSMTIHNSPNLSDSLRFLANERGYTIVAAETGSEATVLPDFGFPERFALVIGSEGGGIAPDVLAACDHIVHIPIDPSIASINAAAASAVMLYAARHQAR